MLRAAKMMAVLLTLSTVNIVRGQRECNDNQGCSSNQYCYNISFLCVNYTQCERHNRHEGPEPAREATQCGGCLPGYEAEKLATGEYPASCRLIKGFKQSEKVPEPANYDGSYGIYVGVGVIVLGVIVISITIAVTKMTKCNIFEATASGRLFEKVSFLSPRPTAPPQDDALNHLQEGPSHREEEKPPMYSSVIPPRVARDLLVNTGLDTPPSWVKVPPYEPADHNHNVADGVAIPTHDSSTTLNMELDEEAETNPSNWRPEPLTVEVPRRPFVRFANSEQHDNVLNNVLMRGNYTSSSHDASGSNDDSEGPEEASGPHRHSGNCYGPNVQINQTIMLNIAKNGTK